MAAINMITARDAVLYELMKRGKKSWPRRNVGVMVVFCIVFIVAFALIVLFVGKKLAARKAAKSNV